MSSDFHSDKWTPLPTHLQVPLHDSYAPEGIHLRGEGRDFLKHPGPAGIYRIGLLEVES